QRFLILPAPCVDGIIALDIFEGLINKIKFISFLHHQLAPKLTPFPGLHSVVVMDNCAIQHHDKVQ
ncbi:hypothetical protein HYDPIDRAFT_58297, partial [Hydnomerulius pinastri MD-312]